MTGTIIQELTLHEISSENVGYIVHAGAGTCKELNEYLELNPKKVILVEAEQHQANLLNSKIKELAIGNVDIIEKVFTHLDVDKLEFFITQPPQFSSTSESSRLQSLFKNLKTKFTKDLETVSLAKIVEQYEISQNEQNFLVVQLNGSEQEFFKNIPLEILQYFGVIYIQSALIDDKYDSINSCASILIEAGFRLTIEKKEDLIFSDYLFVKDEKKNTYQQTIDEYERVKLELSASKNKEEQIENELTIQTKSNQELSEKCQQLEADLKEQTHWNKENKTWAESLKAELEQSKVSLDQKESDLADLTAKHESALEQIEKLNNLLTDKNLSTEQLSKSNQELSEKCQQLEADLKEQTHWHKENKTLAESLKAELEQSLEQSKVSLDQKESDLADLTAKHESALEQIEKLNKLLTDKDLSTEQLSKSNQELSEKCQQLEADLKEQTHWHKENKTWAEALNRELESLTSQFEKATSEKERALNLGQKMLAKAQVDLEQLREAYSEKVNKESELVALVSELREKLAMASQYYFKLQEEHPELIGSFDNHENR